MALRLGCKPFVDSLQFQWIAGFGAMLMLVVSGMMMGWSSPYLAKLTAEDSPLQITNTEASWVASLLNFGRLFGAILGALSVQYIGSRKTLILDGFPLIVCWLCVIFADSVVWLYVARLACGISVGMAFAAFPLYLGEISSPKVRGALVTLATTGLPLGILVGNVIGAYISMAQFSYVSLVPNVAFIALFAWLPDSPHHLVRRNKLEQAKSSIIKYDPKADAILEVEALRLFVSAADKLTLSDRLREFNLPRNRRAGLVIVVLYTIMQLCGINSITFYMESILTEARLSVVAPATMVIIVSSLSIPAGLLAICVADRYGRKALLVVASAGNAIAMIGLGVHFTLLSAGFDAESLQWLPIASLAGYQFFAYFGMCPVPSMVLSELFAPNIKSMAAFLASVTAGVAGFASTKSYQPLVDSLGISSIFWCQAAVMVFAIVFSLICQPETKGKTLQEIQEKLMRR